MTQRGENLMNSSKISIISTFPSAPHKLVIAEKPSVANSLAAVLGAAERKDGYLQGNGYIVSWCYGHLVELARPAAYGEQYKRWAYDALPILPEDWRYDVRQDKKKQLETLRSLMERADVASVINACDCGREGELIFRLAYEYCECQKPIQRLWISSLEDAAIREGFANLRDGAAYDSLYRAALCRAQADWTVGINATRLFSVLYGATLNVGRVQSPTLAMIAEREKAVRAFVSEPFYTPLIDAGGFTASGEKLKAPDEAEAVRAACDGGEAVILSIEKKEKTEAPPKLYDLTALQRDANRLLGYTAQQVLDYAQSLYEKKLCTYPRTDSRYLTGDMAGKLPELANQTFLRLACAVGEAHRFETVSATLACAGHTFAAKGKTVLHDGWKAQDNAFRAWLKKGAALDPREDECAEDGALPELAEGQVLSSVAASVREGKTAPPKRFTEDTLLLAMETASAEAAPDEKVNCSAGAREATLGWAERKGLGTPATRAGVIEKLIRSGFVERKKKLLIPTDKGMSLTAILPEEIKSPLLTADWEQKLKRIERGELEGAAFMDGISALTRGFVAAHTAPEPGFAALFAHRPQGAVVGKCPRCGADVAESKKGFFCASRTCRFALWKDSRFWQAKAKKLDKKTAAALLSEGRVSFSDLKSGRTGKTYAAAIVLEDDGAKVHYRLDFEQKHDGRKSA